MATAAGSLFPVLATPSTTPMGVARSASGERRLLTDSRRLKAIRRPELPSPAQTPRTVKHALNRMNQPMETRNRIIKDQSNRNNANQSNLGNSTNSPRSLAKALALATVLVGVWLAPPAVAATLPLPGSSLACGKTLAQWQEIWYRWAVGAFPLPTDANGNAVSNNMVLMANPRNNDGTVDVTLNANQPFVFHLFTYYGNSYKDGSPNDQFCDLSLFQTLALNLTVDGVQILNGSAAPQYFSQTVLAPPIPITDPSSPFSAYIWLQNVGTVFPPFSVGQHVIKLDVNATMPCFGFNFESHGTWNLTVLPDVPPAPAVIVTSAPGFGFNGGQFGFSLKGPAGQLVVVEASTDLVNWQPIWINTFDGDLSFSDLQRGVYRNRFYRAHTP
jgi:hypothetical protein